MKNLHVTVLISLIVILVAGCGGMGVKEVNCLDNAVILRCCQVKEAFWTSQWCRFEFKKVSSYHISFLTESGSPFFANDSGKTWDFDYDVTDLKKQQEIGEIAVGERGYHGTIIVVIKDMKSGKSERQSVDLDTVAYDDNAPMAYHGQGPF